jgi:hypothetical protein
MGCLEDGAIVPDLIERFCDPDAIQSAPWNINVWRAGVPYHKSSVVAATRMAILVEKDYLTGSGRNVGRRRRR